METRHLSGASMTPDVSVVIVSYNTRELLRQCVRGIPSSLLAVRYEIIVVDNASSDGAAAMIAREFPQVQLVANDSNRYAAAGLNQGIRLARGRYVLMLNPDIQFAQETFERMYGFLEAHAEVGAVSPCLVDADGVPETGFWRDRTFTFFLFNYTLLRYVFPRTTAAVRDAEVLAGVDRTAVHEVDMMIDASMLVRREALLQIGLWDEDFKLYFCDDDLTLRLRRAGWKLVFLGDVVNRHLRHQSVRQQSREWVIQVYREDALKYSRKHFGRARTAVLWALFRVTAALHWLRLRAQGSVAA